MPSFFTVRGQTEAFLRPESGAPLTVNQQVVCGAVAGIAVSFLACPNADMDTSLNWKETKKRKRRQIKDVHQ
ncbi:hypothetical protein K7X08_031217 [Anisodus acutangulus]|uniref:Uncharacterized protein n=1 Tax=Anisodus acutangulus TaxID=402998 RepID=A0A9Q1MKR0_9SOLA|nr:hypothetical protein K7X08_031217 [Anisodus acutangulus]